MHKTKLQWIALLGKAEISESSIRFVGEPPPKKKATDDTTVSEDPRPFSILRSDMYFETGDIQGEMFLQDPSSKLQFRLSNEEGRTVFVGINLGDQPYGISVREDGKIDSISSAGQGSNLPAGEWFPFHIRVRGSHVELFIRGIRVVHGQTRVARSQLELVLRGFGSVEVRNLSVHTVRPQVFVVMQFTDEYTALYREVIEPVCSEYGYEVVRGDNVYTNRLIIEDIVQSIRASSLIIADITPNNSNVYYEVGFAHGIGKTTILLSDRIREKLPFDISGFRLLFYDNTIGGKSAVETALRKHLDAIRGA